MPILLVCIFTALMLMGESAEPAFAQAELSRAEQVVLSQLMRQSKGTMEITWNEVTKTPLRVTGLLSAPSNHSIEWIAFSYLQKTKKLYGLADVKKSFRVKYTKVLANGTKRVELERLLFGVPVLKDNLMMDITAEGVLISVSGRITPFLEKKLYGYSMHPAYSASDAIRLATGQAAKSEPLSSARASCTLFYVIEDNLPVLAYVVSLTYPNGLTEEIIIHAVTKRRIPT